MNSKYDEFIKEWIEENKQEVLDDWISICKIPSIKGEKAPNTPFGENCAKALIECTNLFEKRGFDTKIYAESGYSLISFGQGSKTIGLFTHSDVVPAGEDWLYTKPFEPIIKDGALIGRGVEDNKSGIIASLCAMEIIKKNNIPLKSRIQLFIGSNEETGMEDIEAFVKEQNMPDVSIIPDADFPCSTGEKGICQLYAKSDKKVTDIIDFCGGEAFNIVLDKAIVKLKYKKELETELSEKLKANNAISMYKEEDILALCAKGIAKHASEPDGSVNAAYLLAQLLAEINSLNDTDRQIMRQTKEVLSCPFGTSLKIDYCDDLFGKLTFVNGMVSVVDERISLSFDMRYSSALDSKELEQRTKEALKSFGFETTIKANLPGFSIDGDNKIPSIFEGIYNEITGFDKKTFKMGGGTYARHLKNAFSVGTFTRTKEQNTPVLKMPEGHGGAHQCDEMIDIESFFNAVRILVHYIVEADGEINR